MPIFGHKSLNSVKTTLYYRPKKSIGYPFFFPIFHKKILLSCPYFVKKHPFLKNTQLSCPYFVKKTSILSKILCSHAFFSNFSFKTLCCHAHIWPENVNSSKQHYIMDQNSQQDALFFRFFMKKSMLSCPYFDNKTSIVIKRHCSNAHILLKNVHSLKNTVLSCHFFKYVMKNPLQSCPYLFKTTSNLSKLHYIMRPKSQQDDLFSRYLFACTYFNSKIN